MTEEQIIERCKALDRKGQRCFVDTYSPYLYGICLRYLGSSSYSKDCLQESLIKILHKVDLYKGGSFKAWIAKITVNTCLEFIRKNRKHFQWRDIEDVIKPYPNQPMLKLAVEDVLTFLESLPMEYRIVVNMYIIEGYSHKEVAAYLGVKESTSRSLLTRVRKKLQDRFPEYKGEKLEKLMN